MSDLVAIAYDDEATANELMTGLAKLQSEYAIELEDAVVVTHHDGQVKLHQPSLTAAGAAGGAMWGGLIGLLFLAPLVGMAVGAASGAVAGAAADPGLDDKFLEELGNRLESGGAAVIVLVRKATPDRVLAEIAPYGGHVIQTSLSKDREAELQAALDRRGEPV